MKLPLSWLKKYIPVSLSAEKLEEMLTMSGSKVEALHKKGGEDVIEIEVTTNRPDCLSILGLAHEVSALTGKKVTAPKSYSQKEKLSQPARGGSASGGKLFDIVVENKKVCPLYTARLIQQVTIKPAPAEAQKFLELTDTRAISNVVDATNFVLFESGQPLHAFDFDKIRGGKIIVRSSVKGEKFLGIDGVEYTLDEKTLVIADAERAIAIAGVIGGRLTEVTSSTKNILLESAYFDPAAVRQAARKYKISTDSSYRFERGVDPMGVAAASRRASELIRGWAGGEDISGFVEKNYQGKNKLRDIVLHVSRVEQLLGMAVPQKRILAILKTLSLDVRASGKEKVLVKPSSFRRDITQETDLIEEVLRIEGFEKIPVVIPSTRYNAVDPEDRKAARVMGLKNFLSALGFSEIVTYSLVSSKMLQDAGFSLEKAHRVVNSASAAQEYFRPSLLPGMLEAAVFNIHRKAPGLKLFEVGNRYTNGREETVLGILFYGLVESHWQKKTEASYYGLKGILSNLFKMLGVENSGLENVTSIPVQVLKNFDIPHDVFYAELVLDEILARARKNVRVKPVPKFPVVRRDLAFVVDEKIHVEDLENCMRTSAVPHLREVALFDQYIGKNIAAGKRSLAFSLSYEKETGTFTDSEIQALQERVGQALKSQYAVEFR